MLYSRFVFCTRSTCRCTRDIAERPRGPSGVAAFMPSHSKTPYITPSMDFYSSNGVVWGRRGPQLEFSLVQGTPHFSNHDCWRRFEAPKPCDEIVQSFKTDIMIVASKRRQFEKGRGWYSSVWPSLKRGVGGIVVCGQFEKGCGWYSSVWPV